MIFFLIFHHNLAFSSVPASHYRFIISHVYEQILELAEDGIPLGLEYTGETLEIIQQLRPDFIRRLRSLVQDEQAELIGSSYSQAIFPLIPAEVNLWNLQLGLKTYEQLLDTRPELAYINEQCFSDGLPELYRDQGYKAMILDWMNARKGNDWPVPWRFQPLLHEPTGMHFLWNDSISFQKFQRTVWGELAPREWKNFIIRQEQLAADLNVGNPVFSLYGSDAEVFDYRPGTLETRTAARGHFNRIRDLLTWIRSRSNTSAIEFPSWALRRGTSHHRPPGVQKLCTPAHPIKTKKQDKYNVTRWAVTGRASTRMNSQCFRLFNTLRSLQKSSMDRDMLHFLQKEVVRLWGSDFRTHTTDEKIELFRNAMGAALFHAGAANSTDIVPSTQLADHTGTTTKKPHSNDRRIILENNHCRLIVLKNRGLAVEEFSCSGAPALLGTIPHGYYADISLGSDFYTGHLMLLTQDGHQYTDLSNTIAEVDILETDNTITVRNSTPMKLPGLLLCKTLTLGDHSLTIEYEMYAKDLRPASLRLGICTFPPETFNRKSLFFETVNGGKNPERFILATTPVRQHTPVNHTVTCKHCLGNVNGQLIVGDSARCLAILTDHSELYSVPLVHFEPALDQMGQKSYFLRIYHSICERDDVANVFWKGRMNIRFEIRIC